MLRPRLIASLLVDHHLHLVKTTCFAQRHYLGDPLNAAYVFSGYEVDELLVLAIDASQESQCIPLHFVESLARFTTVPLCVGGGFSTLNQIHDVLALGVEKVAISSALRSGLAFLEQAACQFGSSTISVILNLVRGRDGEPLVCFGRPAPGNACLPLFSLALACQSAGAGEIILHDTEAEGTRRGFDVSLLANLNDHLAIPLVSLGGCGTNAHISELLSASLLSGVAAGSLFSYAPGTHQVLLNYCPTHRWLNSQLPVLHSAWR